MSKKTLVIGASVNESRYSNMAMKRLKFFHHEVVAIGLKEGMVDQIPIGTNLTPFTDIDTVAMYVGPQKQAAYYDYIVSLQPKRVIFNPGTENDEFYEILKAHNIPYFEYCTLVLLNTGQF